MNPLLRAATFAVLTLTALLWAGSVSAASTVTIGGKSVELPDDIAEEHQKLIDNIGIYDDPELDAYVRGVGERYCATRASPSRNSALRCSTRLTSMPSRCRAA